MKNIAFTFLKYLQSARGRGKDMIVAETLYRVDCEIRPGGYLDEAYPNTHTPDQYEVLGITALETTYHFCDGSRTRTLCYGKDGVNVKLTKRTSPLFLQMERIAPHEAPHPSSDTEEPPGHPLPGVVSIIQQIISEA